MTRATVPWYFKLERIFWRAAEFAGGAGLCRIPWELFGTDKENQRKGRGVAGKYLNILGA
ncbi:hypothetical protein [Azohydromonas lata]|uniref:hypothetical protein n=1 Tax=Azohydromonas lata TaxID=45677 RepID=UPI001471A12F|nr:hypothetical protein [Azohydromonas lata]